MKILLVKHIEALVDALARGIIDKPTYNRRLSEIQKDMGNKSKLMFTLEGGQKFGGQKFGGEQFGGAEFGASRKSVAGLGYADQPTTDQSSIVQDI
jgi:hypothetical protein